MYELAGIFLSTFVAEDAAAVATALLAQQGRIGLVPGIVACAAGIYVGDLGLWVAGRCFRTRLHRWPFFGRSASRVETVVGSAAPLAILGSRLLPGTRLPLYVVSGASGVPLGQFALWSFVAVAIWTPAIIVLALGADAAIRQRLPAVGSSGWGTMVAITIMLVVLLRTGLAIAARLRPGTLVERLRLAAERIRRWEFWPMWAFYPPVALWTLWLACRHGGFSTITAANPGIADGGVVGESKHDILRRLPSHWTLPSIAVAPGDTRARLRVLLDGMRQRQMAWPVILKPDVGQRGVGVKLVRSLADARDYLRQVPAAVVAQRYHPGPFEAGVFYYRFPAESRGRILSVTDKHFPVVTGDGRSTLESLIRGHERYRMQAGTFLARLGDERLRIPRTGEHVRLAIAGNHAQGTLFRDGRHLITPALAERIDRIARSYGGFFIGRFDIRYSEVDAFKAGRDLAIVELNGATAESTEIYDPDGSLLSAYGKLFRQWSLVFAIGAANRRTGAAVTSPSRLWSLLHTHLTSSVPLPLSD